MSKQRIKPPRFGGWILHRFAHHDEDFDVKGDFDEEYYEVINDRGRCYAWVWYWRLLFFSLPFFMKDALYWRFVMFTNYIKITLRNLIKHKTFSFINVAGLAIGITVSLLILLYVWHEMTYDWCHQKSQHIYRIVTKMETPDRQLEVPTQAAPLAPLLVEQFPEVIHAARMREASDRVVAYRDRQFEETNILYGDPGVMDVFTIRVLKGDPKTFLEAPFSLIITDVMAEKYFGSEEPLGKTVRWDDEHEFTITGVVEKLPDNSHFKFNMLASLSTLNRIGLPYERLDQWMGLNFYTYLELQKGVSIEGLADKYADVVKSHMAQIMEQLGVKLELSLQSFRSIHLHPNLIGDLEPGGNPAMLRIYTTIALFILLIGCINFMNLSTSQSSHRAKEVGMRKVLGAHKRKLVAQFLGESIILSLFSMILAMILIQLLLPLFNQLIGKSLTYHPIRDWPVSLGIVALTGFVGFISGVYPAFFLSSFVPVHILRKKSTMGRGHRWFRNGLVSLQYIISIALICSTWVIYTQLGFVKNLNLGFDKEHVMVIPLEGSVQQAHEAFKTELQELAGVIHVSGSSLVPGRGLNETMFTFEDSEDGEPRVLPFMDIDADYLETMGIPLAKGRNFSNDFPGDPSGSILINETLAKELMWEDPLDKTVYMTEVVDGEFLPMPYKVIGVVRDFHFESLHAPLRAQIIRMPGEVHFISVKIRSEKISEALESIQATWEEIEPSHPFHYEFLDDVFDRLYHTELRLGQIFIAFTGIAITIACLGLFGLAAYTAEQRTKEIGIRKVLGASIPGVVVMLSRQFTKWVILANVVAWPLAYYAMNAWLRHFAYRIDLKIWMFLVSGGIALLIAVLTVSVQAVRAASTNPVNTLRYE